MDDLISTGAWIIQLLTPAAFRKSMEKLNKQCGITDKRRRHRHPWCDEVSPNRVSLRNRGWHTVCCFDNTGLVPGV
eukprot:1142098-Pelagomonas_calceolata.AAC.3